MSSTANGRTHDMAAIASEVVRLTTPIFAAIDSLTNTASEKVDLLDATAFEESSAWSALEPTAKSLLTTTSLMIGCGLAITGTANDHDTPPSMAWWVRDGQRIIPKHHIFNPRSDSFYDVRQSPWFAEPSTSRRKTLLAPYVDSWGTDDLTMTACLPVVIGDVVVAVVAADLDVRQFVTHVEALLRRSGRTLAMLDGEDRAIASTTPDLTPGTRLITVKDLGVVDRTVISEFGWWLVRLVPA